MPTLSLGNQIDIINKLSTSTGGIVDLNLSFIERIREFFAERLGRIYIIPQVRAILSKIPSQPSFLITRNSWKLLMEGEVRRPDGSIWNWVAKQYPNYKVFGFVFCVCEVTDEFAETIVLYFRIRTILKNINSTSKGSQIIVDSENFAYTVMYNDASKKGSDNLMFIEETENSFGRRGSINNEVIKVPDFGYSQNPIAMKLGKIQNNGNYFSKERIDNILLQNQNSLGTVISIGAEPSGFKFYFKVNPKFETNLPCPTPPVCE